MVCKIRSNADLSVFLCVCSSIPSPSTSWRCRSSRWRSVGHEGLGIGRQGGIRGMRGGLVLGFSQK